MKLGLAAASSAHQSAGTLALVRKWKAWNILSPAVVIYPWWAVVRKPNHSGHLILVYIFIDSHPLQEMEVRNPESWDLSDSPRCCRPHPLDLTGHWAQVTIIPWRRILSHTNHMMTCRFTECACDPWLGCSLGQIDLAWEAKWNYWNEICFSESSKYLHNNQYSHFHTLSAVMWAQDNSGFACLEPFSGWTRCDVLLEINELRWFYDIPIPHPAYPSYPIIQKHPDAISLIWLIKCGPFLKTSQNDWMVHLRFFSQRSTPLKMVFDWRLSGAKIAQAFAWKHTATSSSICNNCSCCGKNGRWYREAIAFRQKEFGSQTNNRLLS